MAAARIVCMVVVICELDCPGIHNDSVGLLVEKDAVENVQWVYGNNSGDECFFRLSVKGLGREAAAVHLAAFFHELGETLVDEKVPWKRFVSEGGKPALEAHGDARPIEEDGGLVAFSLKACGGERVDNTD